MKKIFISAALASMMMASCQNDVLVENISNDGDMFTLEVNQGGSRTALSGIQTVWSGDEKIFVTSQDGEVTGVLSFKGNNQFSGYIFGGKASELSHVIYPVPVDGKVELKQPKGDRLDLPMIGELGSDKTSVVMANVCALVNLPVEGKTSIGLSSVGENTLTGHYEYKDGEFVFVPGEGSITVNVTDGKAFFATAVPTDNQGVEEDQVELKINGTDETITVPVEQGLISKNNVPEIEFNEDGTMKEPVMNVTTAEILEKALNQYDEVKLAGNIEITEAITIAAEKEVTLDLNGFALDGKITNNGALTIVNSNINMNASSFIVEGETPIFKGGTFTYNIYDTYSQLSQGFSQSGVEGKYFIIPDNSVVATNIDNFKTCLANIKNYQTIILANNIEGDVTVVQQENIKFTIDGTHKTLVGTICVDGQSSRIATAGLVIKNINFMLEDTNFDAYVRLGGSTPARYTHGVTVEGCNFDTNANKDIVAVKSYTGGDLNTKIIDCKVSANMHSLAQLANVEKGLEIISCEVYSKNGVNLNQTPSLYMDDCTFDVRGYAVRFGVNGTVGGSEKSFEIVNSTLESACEEDEDAVIIFRDSAKEATLVLTNTTLIGVREFIGAEGVTFN